MNIPSYAEAQLEREKIKAHQAKKAFASANKNSIPAQDAEKIKKTLHDALKLEFSTLATSLVDAIEDVADETQIHYLMSDQIYTWSRELSDKLSTGLNDSQIGQSFARNLTPKPLMTVSQCAEKYRYIKTGTNMPGPWRNENSPIVVEIMDALSLHSPCKKVTFKKASGISGTEIWLNWLLYIIMHAKKDVMLVSPDRPLLNRTFIPRIRKMFKESPALRKLEIGRNSEDIIEIGDTKISTAYATNEDSFRAEHVIYTITDEKSAMPLSIGKEGDVGMLTGNRRKSFSRQKAFDVSSPTVEGFCQISDDYDEGTQETRHIFCPSCGHSHPFIFENFRFDRSPTDKMKVTDAFFVCPECNHKIPESIKNDLIDKSVWIAKYPDRMNYHRSFTANSFYIKFGLGLTWVEIAQLWLKAQEDTNKLVTFMNTFLAETSTVDFEGIEAGNLVTRLETFPDTMPDVVRLFGADVQANRIELTIFDFEANSESWAQIHLILEGNPKEPEDTVWHDLAEVAQTYQIDFGCIDSSYLSKQVYQFCQKNRWCHPIQGQAGSKIPFTEDRTTRNKKLRSRSKNGIKPEMLGVHTGKLLVHSRLKQESKTAYDVDMQTGEILSIKREPNPGYIHFRNDSCFDVKYFEQLAAERLEIKKRKGQRIEEWVNHGPDGGRNEAFDCAVYATAAFYIAQDMRKLHFSQKPSIEDIEAGRPTPQPKEIDTPKHPLKRKLRGR